MSEKGQSEASVNSGLKRERDELRNQVAALKDQLARSYRERDDSINKLSDDLKALRGRIAELEAQTYGNESWWDQNSVRCQNCSAELVVRNSSIPQNHSALSHEEGEEESLCGYCAGEELHRIEHTIQAAEKLAEALISGEHLFKLSDMKGGYMWPKLLEKRDSALTQWEEVRRGK